MLQLRRLRFESVGHRDARLAPLLLDFTGEAGLPMHTVLWLRNGGGKSSILNLIFALVRPDRREFLGKEERGRDRRLGDYVLRGDTAHVVAEWARPGEANAALVTGMVLEWKDRTPSNDESRLSRLWYGFSVEAGADLFEARRPLDLDSLPVTEDGRRLPLARYRERLWELAAENPAAELTFAPTQTHWREYLERRRLDTEVFRYQLLMNREEGGASRLFKQRCRTNEGFVELLLELAIPPEQPENIAGVYARVADQISRRPTLERDLRFVTGARERLDPLVRSVAEHHRCETALRTAAEDAARLAATLSASARDAESRQRNHENGRANFLRKAGEEETRRHRVSDQRDAARHLADRLRLARKKEELSRAEAVKNQASLDLSAWELVPVLTDLDAARAEVTELESALDEVEREARPILEERDRAAAALAARLLTDEEGNRAAAREALEEASTTEERARTAEEERRRLAGENASLKHEREAIRSRRGELAARRKELESAGAMAPDEPAEEALKRTDAGIREHESRRAAAVERLKALRREDEATVESREQSRKTLAEEERNGDRLRKTRRELERRLDRLRTDPRIGEVAETSSPDIFSAGEMLAARLTDFAAAAEGGILKEELAAVADRRSLASLSTTGLLPPRAAVERILARLAEEDIPAVPGWQYLAGGVRAEVREGLLRRHPEMADGIVVTDPERLPFAREVLESAGLDPAAAVVVGTSAALERDEGDPVGGSFLVPPAPALFLREAGESETDRRRARLSGVHERTDRLRTDRDRDVELARRLRVFLADFPESTRRDLEKREEAHASARAALLLEIERLDELIRGLGRERTEAEAAHARAEAGERALLALRPGLENLVRLAARDAADTVRFRRVETLLVENREADRVAEKDAASATERARSLREQAAERRSAADRLSARRRDLGLPEPEGKAPDDPVEVLEERFRLLDERYSKQVSDPVLIERKQAAEIRRSHLLAHREEATPEVRERAEDLRARPEALDEMSRKGALTAAKTERDRAVARAGVAGAGVQSAREDLESRRPEGTPADLPEPVPTKPEEAEGLARRLHEEMTAASQSATEHRKSAERERDRAHVAERSVGKFQAASSELRSALAYVDHEAPDGADAFEGDAEEGGEASRAARGSLESSIRSERTAGLTRDDYAKKLRTFASDRRFDALEGPLRDRLTRDPDPVLFARAGELAADLTLREQTCREQIAESNRHRDLLVREIAQAVEEALRVLRRAEKASVLPEGFRDWSGQRFLHIRNGSPGKDEEVFGRLSRLVDELVERGDRPRGLPLLLRSVNAVIGPDGFRVSILKPNATLRADRVPVTDLATFSGGEQLTAAVLLYTTLALMRGHNRGYGRTGGLLLLDNPIGKSSNVTFLDLQTKVADAARLQLLYTTAVDDRDAIASFPHWIRLKNERADRRTGNQHVETDQTSRLSAARIWRKPPSDAGGDGEG